MAHISGFGGTITMTGGPTGLIASGPLQAWSLNQEAGSFRCHGKGETWKTAFQTIRRWSAEVTALLPLAAATADWTGRAAISALTLTMNGTQSYAGVGTLEEMTIDDPLDGPITVRLRIRGNGALTPTANN